MLYMSSPSFRSSIPSIVKRLQKVAYPFFGLHVRVAACGGGKGWSLLSCNTRPTFDEVPGIFPLSPIISGVFSVSLCSLSVASHLAHRSLDPRVCFTRLRPANSRTMHVWVVIGRAASSSITSAHTTTHASVAASGKCRNRCKSGGPTMPANLSGENARRPTAYNQLWKHEHFGVMAANQAPAVSSMVSNANAVLDAPRRERSEPWPLEERPVVDHLSADTFARCLFCTQPSREAFEHRG